VTEDIGAAHGVAGGCTTGRDAKPGGTLGVGGEIGSGWKPGGTTGTGRGAEMGGGAAADVRVSKKSKSLVKRCEAEKGNFVLSNATCQETMM
jgi:hypothetical protein